MTDPQDKMNKNRLQDLDQFHQTAEANSEDSEHSFVYDILSEGNAFVTKQRPRSYSLHAGRCTTRENITRNKSHGRRRMSLPANEARIHRNRPEVGNQSNHVNQDQIHDNDSAGLSDNLRNRRARSFKERSNKEGENHRRVRSFKTTSRGLVNRGDIYEVKREPEAEKSNDSKTNTSMNDTLQVFGPESPRPNVRKNGKGQAYFKVLLTGASDVGKSSIIDQFMTSEFLGSGAFNISQSEGDRTVTLQVDGEESTLEFVQSEDFQDQEESFQIDAFVVVYCITERVTFDIAIDLLKQIREEVGSNKAIILVANKSDLVRKRTISQEEGRSAADGYGCKYIELSAALNHRVDELLVGIHKQIRLKSDAETEEIECKVSKTKDRKSSFKRTKRFLEKVFLGHSGKDKKTENLYVD